MNKEIIWHSTRRPSNVLCYTLKYLCWWLPNRTRENLARRQASNTTGIYFCRLGNVIIHENTKITTLRGDTNGQTKNRYSTGIPVGNGNYLRDFTELNRSKNFTESEISVFN